MAKNGIYFWELEAEIILIILKYTTTEYLISRCQQKKI